MAMGFDRDVLKKRIVEARERKGMNQARLAEEAGITPSAISQIEKGLRVPTIPVVRRIANVLGVSIDYLTGKTEEPEIRDMLQYEDAKTFFRKFKSLHPDDQETISELMELMEKKKK